MRGSSHNIWLSLVLLFLMSGCNTALNQMKVIGYPGMEVHEPLDRDEFVAYLDSAAIDDWEGLWLMVGPGVHNYLAIERINDRNDNAYYTHRIRLWSNLSVNDPMTLASIDVVGSPGLLVGYLGQSLLDYTKYMTLLGGVVWKQGETNMLVELDESRRYIIFNKPRIKKKFGMRRIYPIRDAVEREYKVRYL